MLRHTLALAMLVAPAGATDLFVPADHATIQEAILASADGDVIHVAAGTWPGALDTLDRDVTIAGAGADVTIIDGQGAERVVACDDITAVVTLRDVTVTGGQLGLGTPVADGPVIHLERCTFRDLTGGATEGLVHALDSAFLDNGGSGLVRFLSAEGCTFEGNQGWGAVGYGFPLAPPVSNCRFAGNGLGGVWMFATNVASQVEPEIVVTGSVFLGDTLQVSANGPHGSGLTAVSRCSFMDSTLKLMQGNVHVDHAILRGASPIVDFSTGGVGVDYSNVQGGWPGTGNIDADPLWADPVAGDFALQPGSPCINAGDPAAAPDPDGSAPDMGAVTYHPWLTLGAGAALLDGAGPLVAGQPFSLELSSAPAGAATWLVVGLAPSGAPFKGATLWAQPDALFGAFPVAPGGTLSIGATWPAGLPAGTSFWSQLWWPDAALPQGWSASNGLRGSQP